MFFYKAVFINKIYQKLFTFFRSGKALKYSKKLVRNALIFCVFCVIGLKYHCAFSMVTGLP